MHLLKKEAKRILFANSIKRQTMSNNFKQTWLSLRLLELKQNLLRISIHNLQKTLSIYNVIAILDL